MDEALHIGLWNISYEFYWSDFSSGYSTYDGDLLEFADSLWVDFWGKPTDERLASKPYFQFVKNHYMKADWNKVYDLLEATVIFYPKKKKASTRRFMQKCNEVLEKELSAYRFVNGLITEITSEQEIAAIEEAIAIAPDPVKIHLDQALKHFSDRQNPDYRNSIKESISAVEAMCIRITGNPQATLGQALKVLEAKISLHPALKSAYSSLYGYTSDSNGIRHALMDEPNLGAEDAKFMLVSCSGFINYLVAKAVKAGINL